MDSFLADLPGAARVLRKNPGFTVAALVTLALGIGATTAIFSVVNTVLIRPLPFAEANRIVLLREKRPAENVERGSVSVPDFQDWQRQAHSFSAMALYDWSPGLVVGGGSEPERVAGAAVTSQFLDALGVSPFLGRGFGPDEDRVGNGRVVLLSYSFWQRRGADMGIAGKTLQLNSEPYTILGVMPEDFRYPFAADCELLTPLLFRPEVLQYRGIHPFFGVARLAPGVTAPHASAEMDLISQQLERQYPDANRGHAAALLPLRDEMAREVRPALRALLYAVLLLGMIACANVAGLLLARGTIRRKEMAVRAALGSGRWRLARQSLTESGLLALGGGGAGALLAIWTLDLFRAGFFQRIDSFARAGLGTATVDWRVLLFTLISTVVAALVFGIAPALATSKADLAEAIRPGARGNTPGSHRARSALIVVEVALSLVLLTGTGLLAKSFLALVRVNPGFRAEHTLTAGLTLPLSRYRTPAQHAAFFDRVAQGANALPGVISAAITDTLPLSGEDNRTGILIFGRTPQPGERWRLHPRIVTPGYLGTMGIPLRQGRDFSESDVAANKYVAVLSETAALRYWPGENALGKRFAFFSDQGPWYSVIGVAASVHNSALEREPTEDVYVPYAASPFPTPRGAATLVVRATAGETALARDVRALMRSLDGSLPVSRIRPLDYYVSDSVGARRFDLILIGAFAAIAMALAAAGIYGLMAYLAAQRATEIGIRMALGARRNQILRLILGNGALLALLGIALGLAGSLAAARLLENLLYGVTPRDPAIYGVTPVVLLAVALAASYLPARRAARIDPMAALRRE
jgi:putative ABC transport system permease protein